MKRTKRLTVLLSAISGAMLVSANMAAAEPFRLILTHLEPPLVPNSVMDLALELGYFEREGVDVELVRVQQTPSALAALLAGEGEMANASVDGVLQLVARGTDTLRAVTSPNKSLPFLIAARSDIASPADLVGHSFGIGRIGSLDHSLSAKVLASEGVDIETLDVVTLGQPAVRAQALAAGQVDATTMSIGVWLSIPDKSGPDQIGLSVLIPQSAYYAAAPVVNKVNVVPAEVLANRREEVVAVVRALVNISRDFAADSDAWADAMASYRGNLTPEEMQMLAKSFDGGWSINGGINREELQYTQDWIYQTEDFKDLTPVALDDWVDFSVIDEVLTDLGTAPGVDQPSR
jgi:NitT/TauT family transport system substrate-binding protein